MVEAPAIAWRPPDANDVAAAEDSKQRRKLLQGKNSRLVYSTVKISWNFICLDSDIHAEVSNRVEVLQQVRVEAAQVANLHCKRLLEQLHRQRQEDRVSLSVLEAQLVLNSTFFYDCCSGVITGSTRRVNYTRTDAFLEETLRIYRAARAAISTYQPPRLVHASNAIRELANRMAVDAKNHIKTNFVNRLQRYVRLHYDTSAKAAAEMVSTLQGARARLTGDVRDLLEWLELRPSSRNLEAHPVHFLDKLNDILVYMERLASRRHPPKGCLLFTLLPQPTSCIPSYISLTSSGLYEIAMGVLARTGRDVLGLCKGVNDRGQGVHATATEFRAVKDRMWTRCFKLNRCVGSTLDPRIGVIRRHFEYRVETDGYGASVLTLIPAAIEDPQLSKLAPHTFIGVDPGMRSIYNAYSRPIYNDENACFAPERCKVCPVENPDRRRKKPRHRTHPRTRRKRKRRSQSKCNVVGWCAICNQHHSRQTPRKHGVRRRSKFQQDQAHVVQATNAEYRHLAKITHHRYWIENLKRRYPRYRSIQAASPSFKTASLARQMNRLKTLWRSLNLQLEFSARKGFRKWRFTLVRFKAKAVAELAARLAPRVDRGVCVALGNWSRQQEMKGHMHAPIGGVTRELHRRATVVSVDEFRTSKLCSNCFIAMKGIRIKSSRRSRNVRQCLNPACVASCWERDVNAAKTMWQLGLRQLQGRSRMEQFNRGFRG